MDAQLPSAEIKNQPSDQPHDDQVSIQEGHEVYQINPAEEKRLLRKLDLTFNLIFMLVYLTCFLDRGNIGKYYVLHTIRLLKLCVGNVRIAGIIPDIHTNATAYGAAISVFYATYILVEIPIPLLMKRLTPCVLLSALCVVWSITTIFTGFVQNIAGLCVARLVLGLCEGGLMPCLNLYLSMVYRREELATRTAYLFSCAAISGAFGGILAYGLLQMDGISGYPGWRYVNLSP